MGNLLTRSKYNQTSTEFENNINKDNLKLLEKFKQDMFLRELSEKTIYNYDRDLKQWLAFVEEKQYGMSICDCQEDDIEEFIFYCKQNGNNAERLKRRISAISSLYTFLRKKKITKDNPCEFISRPKKGLPVVEQTFLSFEQYVNIKNKLYELGDVQLLCYVLLSVSTMARVTAITNLTWGQVNLEEGLINDVLEKEGYIVTLYFNDETKNALIKLKELHAEHNSDKDYVFLTVNDNKTDSQTLFGWTKKVGSMVDLPSLHPHDWRHSGSQMMSLNGAPVELISGLLNHKSTDVTINHYLKPNRDKIKQDKAKYGV